MADINIPGVSDRYKTNDLVQSLLKVERIPLDRTTEMLNTYKAEKTVWQNIGKQMTSLRDSARTLFSYNNPFNEKIATSSNEDVLTATVTREAAFETSKIDVLNNASADKFLSKEFDKNYTVPKGTYTFTTADKKITLNWSGGNLSNFALAINRRNSVVKASVITVTKNTQTLVLESLHTGSENRLGFADDALNFSLEAGIMEKAIDEAVKLAANPADLRPIADIQSAQVHLTDGIISVPPQNGTQIVIPAKVRANAASIIEFSVAAETVSDVVLSKELETTNPILNATGNINFKGVIIENSPGESGLPFVPPPEKQEPVNDLSVLFIRKTDGSETPLAQLKDGEKNIIQIKISDYDSIDSLVIRNNNTARSIQITDLKSYDPSSGNGYRPVQPAAIAQDATLKYEGITLTRSTNEIKDIIPGVTLNLHAISEKPVTLTITPDTQTAKESIITMVGNYNQLVAEINILTQNNPELIAEIEYFTDDDAKAAEERLGMFQGDFTLTNQKNTMQRIIANPYQTTEDTTITMLAQIGISTKANNTAGYTTNQMRGYLEIDEKKLDETLKTNMTGVKNMFGFDSDGDLIIDTGIGYALDKNLQAYVQLNGLIALRTQGLDSKITSTQTQIKRLEAQLASKESDLKRKYGNMEGTLNNLESQSSTISNFNDQQKN